MRFDSVFLPCRDRKLAMRVVGQTRANAGRRRPVEDRVEAWLDSLPEEEAREWARTIDEVRRRIREGVKCSQ